MKKIIYFIDGPEPTGDQLLEAQAFGVKTVFRNAQFVVEVDEECDAVAGEVIPAPYAEFPRAEELVNAMYDDIKQARERIANRVTGLNDLPPAFNENAVRTNEVISHLNTPIKSDVPVDVKTEVKFDGRPEAGETTKLENQDAGATWTANK